MPHHLSFSLVRQIQCNQTPSLLKIDEIDDNILEQSSFDNITECLIHAFRTNTSTHALWLVSADEDLIEAIGLLLQSPVGQVKRLILENIHEDGAAIIARTLTHPWCRLDHLTLDNTNNLCTAMIAQAISDPKCKLERLQLRHLARKSALAIAYALTESSSTLEIIKLDDLNKTALEPLFQKLSKVPNKYRFEYGKNIADSWCSRFQSIDAQASAYAHDASNSAVAPLPPQLAQLQSQFHHQQNQLLGLGSQLMQKLIELQHILYNNSELEHHEPIFSTINSALASLSALIPEPPYHAVALPSPTAAIPRLQT